MNEAAAAPRLSILSDDRLAATTGVRHGFFTRRGGVSEGLFASLNCGPGSADAPERVRENRARAAAALGARPEALLSGHQVHGRDIRVVDRPWPADERPRVDGLVTARPGVVLGILTADCAPVLFADAAAGVIGAAHAGWRGALGGVLDSTVDAMECLGAHRADMIAAVGPCIGHTSYEVGADFAEPFLAEDASNAMFFAPAARAGHRMFALPGYVVSKLARIGVGSVRAVGADTCAEEADFFSYRRATLRGEPSYGRNLSAIMIGP